MSARKNNEVGIAIFMRALRSLLFFLAAITSSIPAWCAGIFRRGNLNKGHPAFAVEGRPDKAHAAACWLFWMNASRSALIWSALVVGIPCGKPGYTLSVAPFTSFADCRAAAPMGTI